MLPYALNSRERLRHCVALARHSPDPSTRLGSLLYDARGELIAESWNRLPFGAIVTAAQLADRDFKLKVMIHAEMAVVLEACRLGRSTLGSTLYFAATNGAGEVWGGAPCAYCAIHLIKAGVSRIVSPPARLRPSRWDETTALGADLLRRARVVCEEVNL